MCYQWNFACLSSSSNVILIDPGRPLSCTQIAITVYTYFKKGCFSDACFIDRSASCLLNLWLLFSSYYRTCSPKNKNKFIFFIIWFSPGVP